MNQLEEKLSIVETTSSNLDELKSIKNKLFNKNLISCAKIFGPIDVSYKWDGKIIDDKEFYGMMNIGHRPTIGENKKSIEVHLFDFDNDIYDKTISVDVLLKIRDEIKFSSIEALKEQLKKDETYCIQLINK